MNYFDKITEMIEKTKKNAETALKQSSASSESSVVMPKREDYDSFDAYLRAERLARAGKTDTRGETDSDVILPNRKNYTSFNEYLRDDRLARSGRLVFSTDAYNHGVDSDYVSGLVNDVQSFVKDQTAVLQNNPFGDTAAADNATNAIEEFKKRLENVQKYRFEVSDDISKKPGTFTNPMETARKDGASDIVNSLDSTISFVNNALDYVDKAWEAEKVKYIHFGNDEAAYKDALMRASHEYDTYAEVQAALGNPGRVSRMSAEELDYLSNYGIRHGYSDPAEYDKEIAALKEERDSINALLDADPDRGGENAEAYLERLNTIDSHITTLSMQRDTLAQSQAIWSSYAPFLNAEDFDAMSKYQGKGGYLGEYINAGEATQADMRKDLGRGVTTYNDSEKGFQLVLNVPSRDMSKYDLLTEDEVAMYNYLMNTQGEEAASVFLDSIDGLVEDRAEQRFLNEKAAFAKKNVLTGALASLESLALSFESMALTPLQIGANLVGAEGLAEDLGRPALTSGTIRGAVGEGISDALGGGIAGGAGKVIYNAAMSAADMFIASKIGGVKAAGGVESQKLAQTMTQVIMSSQAASSAMADANSRGIYGAEAAIYGLGVGVIEWITEEKSLEAWMKTPATKRGYILKNLFAEGSEEAAAEVLGNAYDVILNGDKSVMMSRYHELIAGGASPKEATKTVLLEHLKEVGVATITGAVSGAMISTPTALRYNPAKNIGVRTKNDSSIIISEGLKADPSSSLYKAAAAAQAKLDQNKKVTDADISKIIVEGGDEIIEAFQKAKKQQQRERETAGVFTTAEQREAARASENIATENAESSRESFEYIEGADSSTQNTTVENAGSAQEAFEASDVKVQAEREKAPIIDPASVKAGTDTSYNRRSITLDEMTVDSRTRAENVQRVAKVFKKDVSFYASANTKENGYYDTRTGSININVYAKNPLSVVFGHELTHGSESSKHYAFLQTAVEKFLDKAAKEDPTGKTLDFYTQANNLMKSRAAKGREYEVSFEGAKREVVANFISETLFSDEATIKKFVAQNRSAGQRILEAIRSMLRKVTRGHAGYGTLKDIERLYAKALRDTAKTEAKKPASGVFTKASKAEISTEEYFTELGRKLRNKEITGEEFDRLYYERVSKDKAYRDLIDADARKTMGFTDRTDAADVNQEKRFDVVEDVRALEDGGEDPEGTVYASDGNGHLQFSVSTYEEDGRDILSTYLDKQVADGALTREDADSMIRSLDLIHDTMLKYENKYASYGAWARAEVVTDDRGRPVFSVVTPNGEYAMNIDFSLVCKKRRTLDAVLNRMVSRGLIGKVILGPAQLARINEIIKDHGFEIACDMCYVDAKRYRQADVADSFVSLYNELVNAITPEGSKAVYFDFAGDTTLDTEGEGIHSLEGLDLSALDEAIKENGKRSVIGRAAAHLKANPSDRRLLSRGDFVSSAGFGSVKANNPAILKLYNAKKGAGGPKATFGDTQYLNDILSKKSFNAEKAFRVGGVRVQSYSDYVARLVFDYCQLVADMAAKGLPSHAYTKEALFAMQFGLTGMKINLSLVPKVVDGGVAAGLDESGDYAWADESFDFDTAIDIQSKEGYTENCGTIAVGVSDMHIRTLLRDPRIRMVIPYHKSSLNPVVAEMKNIDGFTNYESVQNTRTADGSALTKAQLRTQPNVNKLMHDGMSPRDAAKAYLDWCRDNGYTPKFDKFVKEDGYYKLLIDFTVFDEGGNFVPQRAVTMTFPTDESAFGSFDTLVDQGLNEDDVAEGERSESVDAIIDEIVSELGQVDEASDLQFSVAGDEIMSQAVKTFGTTTDFAEAGFILPSGELLKLTDDYHSGERAYDHRAIGIAYGVDVDLGVNHGYNAESNKHLDDFVDKGGIRFDPGSIEFNHDAMMQLSKNTPLTREQEQTIRDFIEWKKQQEEMYNPDDYEWSLYRGPLGLRIDFGNTSDIRISADRSALGIDSLSYDGGQINADRIIADIRHYYHTGETRQASSLARFLYSVEGDEDLPSRDSDGQKLTKGQQEYFKDSKVRDENGALKLVYHASPTAGYTVFDGGKGEGNYRFKNYGKSVTFFTDSREMSDSYAPSAERMNVRKLNKMGDKRVGGQYEGYLNLKNPYVVDAEGRYWNEVEQEFSPERFMEISSAFTSAEKAALIDLASWENLSGFREEINEAIKNTSSEASRRLARAYNKFPDMEALYDMASDDFSDESIERNAVDKVTTNDIVERALRDGSYDGVIIKNVVDYGGHAQSESRTPATDYIAFNSNQFKARDNKNPTVNEDIRYSVDDSGETELQAAVEAQGRELLDSYIDTEAPPAVEQEYTEGNVNLPTTDYLRGRWVGYDTPEKAVKALAKGTLSKAKGEELAKLIGMPTAADPSGKTSVVVPFRTYFAIDSIQPYRRRDTGETVSVVGYALPVARPDGVWLHYYNAQSQEHTEGFFTWDEITRTKAQHVNTYAEWDAYLEFVDRMGNEQIPENARPTEKDLREWREKDRDYMFVPAETQQEALEIHEQMSATARNYIANEMRDFRKAVADTLSIPKSYADGTGIMEGADALASFYLTHGSFDTDLVGEVFEKLFDESSKISKEFYSSYQDALKTIKNTKLVIDKDSAEELKGGYKAFRINAETMGVTVTNKAVGKEGVNVSEFYKKLVNAYPSLFPESRKHPASQLEKILEIAREISKSKEAALAPASEAKQWASKQFETELRVLAGKLNNAIKRTQEDITKKQLASAEFKTEAQEILELGLKVPGMLREIDKLRYKTLLSEHDEQVIGDLLSGYISEAAVRDNEPNSDEILQMYRARREYNDVVKTLREFRNRVTTANREIAKSVMGDITAWHEPKKFAQIRLNAVDLPRIIRDIAPDAKTAERFMETYVDPLRQHNADRVRYVDSIRERVKDIGLERKVRKGDAISESAAVQILGESRAAVQRLEARLKTKKGSYNAKIDGMTIDQWRGEENALWAANPSFSDPEVKARIEKGIKEFREIYDEIHEKMNTALVEEGLSPVQYRAGYFPHFEKEIDTRFIDKVRRYFGIESEDSTLPTEISGRTGDFRPNKQWFANAMERKQKDRDAQMETVLFDAVEGIDRYIETASNLIFYTSDITRFRTLERYIRTASASDALKAEILRIEQDENLSEDEKSDQIAKRCKNQKFALSAFAGYLLEYTNKLAGKKSIVDRGIEALFGRDVFNVSRAITKRYAINATSSLSSALTNFLPWAQGAGEYRPQDFFAALWDVIKNKDVASESDFVTARLGSDRLVKTTTEKIGDATRIPFEFVDRLVATTVVQARYRYNKARGIEDANALYEADSFARGLIGDRSKGMQALIFESNNPFIKLFTQFQLEVNNQVLRLYKDIPRETKATWQASENKAAAAARITASLAGSALATWLLNEAYEEIVGRGPGGDIVGMIFDAIAKGTGWDAFEELLEALHLADDDDEEDKGEGFWAALKQLGSGAAEETPFLGSFLGGGRIPISSIVPDFGTLYDTVTGSDISGKRKAEVAFDELSTPLLYMALPFGGSQIKKSLLAINDMIRGGSYNFNKEGEEQLRYPVEGVADIVRGTLFGTTAMGGGQDWVESGFGQLSADQTRAYEGVVDTGIGRYDAFDVINGLRNLKDENDPEKAAKKPQQIAYIEGLDISDEAKASIYTYMVAGKNSKERGLLLRADEIGITPGTIYRQIVGFETIDAEGQGDAAQKKVDQLADATIREDAKPELYTLINTDKYGKLVEAGVDHEKALDVAWEVAKLLPIEDRKSVTAEQQAAAVLDAGLSEKVAAQFLGKDTREKLSALEEYGVTVTSYVALKKYLLYNNDNNSVSMDEAKKAISKISNGSAVSEPGMPDVALDLSKDEKAALWQMMNSSWKPENNPYSVSVGRKVQKALKALDGDEE